ncbi:MAG TPA: glycosyl hydrolase 115 family protein [Phnomibacter sp.]|nr:glycosyl hydrolase 115 family protein [Phnomibacter sp.]
MKIEFSSFRSFLGILLISTFSAANAQQPLLISETGNSKDFPLYNNGNAPKIVIDRNDDSLVAIVSGLFSKDIKLVTGGRTDVVYTLPRQGPIIIAGTIEHSQLIKELTVSKKMSLVGLANQWEGFQISVIESPFKNISKALVIVGQNKRGVAYGLLELSRQMGVSPWYWWADVPIKKKQSLYVPASTLYSDAPKVKYRGIFLNDEAPALSGWAKLTFGGFNHLFYEKVFELLLRLKANYLWPAMWGNAFNDDDSLNPFLADKWGIVMGTSHHEPMNRSQQEWKRFGSGAWDYDKNADSLRSFWKQGLLNTGKKEVILTIGMRGDGDMPMSEQTATSLLERIVTDQRKMIADVTGKPVTQMPQLWALYKEVQDYYDKGMRVPDDVTLLLCDDNWGNIRKLPKPGESSRSGGYGIYYHFDYVGGPRNYKWINTNNLSKVWQQMNLAYEYNAKQIWIVNVGDLKPMELPISFFLDHAWNPLSWNADNIGQYYRWWASEQFGANYSESIGEVLQRYAVLSARKKPELLSPQTYSINNHQEFASVVDEWRQLLAEVNRISGQLDSTYSSSFFQLVAHPVMAMSNLHELYYYTAMNQSLASLADSAANGFAVSAQYAFAKDSLITNAYHQINGGKWNRMMSQTHIGYTSWQEPRFNKMPVVKRVDNSMVNYVAPTNTTTILSSVIPLNDTATKFVEQNGYVSIAAEHYSKAIGNDSSAWKIIPQIGRKFSGVTTFPVNVISNDYNNSPLLEYRFYSYDSGMARLKLQFVPVLNYHNNEGLKFAISVDDEVPKEIVLNSGADEKKNWNSWVSNNVIEKSVDIKIKHPGLHTIRYYMISPSIVLEHLAIDFGGMKESYLPPNETKW